MDNRYMLLKMNRLLAYDKAQGCRLLLGDAVIVVSEVDALYGDGH